MARPGTYQLQHSQNFLRRPALAEEIVARSGIDGGDLVIEIGPGGGVLTRALAKRAAQVIAIEHDAELAWMLGEHLREVSNVCVFPYDALQFPVPLTPCKVFANIPFRHTSAMIGKLTTGVAPPEDIWLIVQKEAADRYLPGRAMTMVAVSLAPWFVVSVEHLFRRRDFRPAPHVDCVLLRIRRRERPLIPFRDRESFAHLVEAVFSAWQPTLAKALKARLPQRAYRDVMAREWCLEERPSRVDLQTWVSVFEVLAARDDSRIWEALREASDALRAQQATLERPTRTRVARGRDRSR